MTTAPPAVPPVDWAAALIHARRTTLPRRLIAPGPSAAELTLIMDAASAAPDHGECVPWRFVLVPDTARAALAAVFEQSLRERDAAATPEQVARAREKAFRAPVLLLAVAVLGPPGADVPDAERLVSAGCAIQNTLLLATALGYGSALTSGQALRSDALRRLFRLAPDELPLCFLNFGTPASGRARRARPAVGRYFSALEIADGPTDPT